MLSMIAIRTFLSGVAAKLPWQVWAVIGVVAVLAGAGFYINNSAWNRGFNEADEQWQERVDAEIARQVSVNQLALANALAEIERLNEVRRVRDATIARLEEEAAADPNADRESLGDGSVLRLNSVLDGETGPE